MARTVDEQAHAQARNRILDGAERIILTRGFEGMTVQQLLDELQISKGAFYHYYESKLDLLEALIERRLDRVRQLLEPIVCEEGRGALDKLQAIFDATTHFKSQQKELFLSVLHVYFDDGNATFRVKARRGKTLRLAPLLARVIRQGRAEGVFQASSPERTAEIVWGLEQDLSDSLGLLLLSASHGHDVDLQQLQTTVAAYREAIERVLGAPAGSLQLDRTPLVEWLCAARDSA